MFNSYSVLNDNLKSINNYSVRPKRTTYDGMSTWLYVDQKDEENPRNSIRHPLYHELSQEDLKLPEINSNVKAAVHSSRLNFENANVNEYLMHNWYNKRNEVNKVSSIYQTVDGRRGRNGPFENISEGMRSDGAKFLFVQGPRRLVNFDHEAIQKVRKTVGKAQSIYDNTEYRLAYNKNPIEYETEYETNKNNTTPTKGRTVTKALLDKLAKERLELQRLDKQTKYAAEAGNWQLIR